MVMLIWWILCGGRDRTPHFVIFIGWSDVVVSGWLVVAWGKKSYLGLAEISSIACLVYFKDERGLRGSAKLALAKSWSTRGASHQPIFMVSCLIIHSMCFPCLPNRLVNLYVLYTSLPWWG